MNLFSKINLKRLGKNHLPFEKTSHIYLTENAVSKYLAHNNKIKFEKNDTAFAKDIDFVISRFWFKLKKGFNSGDQVPKSFDLINKAKIIISSYINSSVATEYHKINSQYKSNHLTAEDVVRLNLELKEKINLPEYVNEINVDEALDFLDNENFIDNIKKENERKDTLLNETRQELAEYKRKEEESLRIRNQEIKNKENLEIATGKWRKHKEENWRAFYYFMLIVILNAVLITMAFLFGFNNNMKKWLISFNFPQILVSVIYVSLILTEILGSKYIFNKEKTKTGFQWMLSISNLKKQKAKYTSLIIEDLNSKENNNSIRL